MSEVLVLCYHAVSERWPAALSVTPEQFGSHLAVLHGRGYRGVTLTEALSSARDGRLLAVTFDDAYRSVRELARPILDSFGMVASVYVPTGWAGRPGPMRWPGIDQWVGGPHEDELQCMDWGELGSLTEAGWEVGSHTRTHPRLPEVGDEQLADELAGSRHDCEEGLGRSCTTLAYPYGAVDDRVVRAAGNAGYRFAVTLPRGLHKPEQLHWPRVGIYHVDAGWRFRLKVSPAVRAIRGSAVWGALDGLRRAAVRR